MGYQRIEKTQGGGLSPGKLRSMLMGVERKRKDDDLRSQLSEISSTGGSSSDNCKDVDVVSVVPESSASTSSDMLNSEMISDHRLKDPSLFNSRMKTKEDIYLDYDSAHDGMMTNVSSTSVFEFQKAERAPHRVPLAAFSKQAPSKWDDAQKWIASPTSNRPKIGSRKPGYLSYGRQPSVKVVVEVPDQSSSAVLGEPDTKQIDSNQINKGGEQKFINWETDPYSVSDSDTYGKSVIMIKNTVGESSISLSRHDSSASVHNATTFIPPPSTARSVSMRDMGTEMTPIASQEPSRTGTPVRAASPTSSWPSSPGRNSSPVLNNPLGENLDPSKKEKLSEKELQMKTRREIMLLGTQLGKTNIAAWASKEEEYKEGSTSVKNKALERERSQKSVMETRAAAWEEAEKAKYFARFKREEMKIQAWENHQKAKTEAEMRKIEVKVERIRGRAHDKLMNNLAAARLKSEEKRAAAEAKRNREAAKTEKQVEFIRKTGRIPSSFWCCRWCH